MIEVEAEDACVGSPRENTGAGIDIGDNEDNNNKDDTKMLLSIQGWLEEVWQV